MPKKATISIEVSTDSKQGGRKYMEDEISVDFASTEQGDFDYAFFGVFDGHGGPQASHFAKKHLVHEITKQKIFWSDDDENVKKSITEGFLSTHKLMSKAVGQWPRTLSGHPSTAGTTCSVAFITCDGKMYIGHAGDSGILLGVRDKSDGSLKAHCVTVDHKPESPQELKRIEESGGEVVAKAGVPRVVWQRPKVLHKGPVRRSTELDRIPFLAVARSLGDLWSYNMDTDQFVVSPQPDVCSVELDLTRHKCLVLASDGLWNMMKPQEALDLIQHYIDSPCPNAGNNAAELLVQTAIDRWGQRGQRADNTSVIVVKLQEEASTSTNNTPLKSTHVSADIEVGANVEIEEPDVIPQLTPSFSGSTPNADRQNRPWKHKGVKKTPFKHTHTIYRGKSPRSLSSKHRANSMGYKTIRALTKDELSVDPKLVDFVAVSKSGVKIYRMKDAMVPSVPSPLTKKQPPCLPEEYVGVTKGGVTIVKALEIDPDNDHEDDDNDDDEIKESSTCRRVSVTKGGVTIYRDFTNNGADDNDVEVYDQDIDLGASCEVADYKPGRVSPTVQMAKLPDLDVDVDDGKKLTTSCSKVKALDKVVASPLARRTSPRKSYQALFGVEAKSEAVPAKAATTPKSSSKSSKAKGSNSSSSNSGQVASSPNNASPSCSTGKSSREVASNITNNHLNSPVSQRRCSRTAADKPCNIATAGSNTMDIQTASTSSSTPGPKPATSVKSPLKVDILHQDATVPPLVSPIWPKHLEAEIEDNTATAGCDIKVLRSHPGSLPTSIQADILRENLAASSTRRRHTSDVLTGSRSQTLTPGTQNISPFTRLSRKRKNSLDSALSSLPISKRLRARPSSEHKRLKPILAHRTRLAVKASGAFGRS